jgi:hypothetical protein
VSLLEEIDSAEQSSEAKRAGRELVKRLRRCTRGLEELTDEFLGGNITLAALTDIVAFHLPIEIEFKLALLGESNVIQRVQQLVSRLPETPEAKQPPGKFPPGFSNN